MENVFLALDFLFPLFFFCLGRCLKGKTRRALVNSSLQVFCFAALTAPLAYRFFSLAAQGFGTAFLMCVQFALIYAFLNRSKKVLL